MESLSTQDRLVLEGHVCPQNQYSSKSLRLKTQRIDWRTCPSRTAQTSFLGMLFFWYKRSEDLKKYRLLFPLRGDARFLVHDSSHVFGSYIDWPLSRWSGMHRMHRIHGIHGMHGKHVSSACPTLSDRVSFDRQTHRLKAPAAKSASDMTPQPIPTYPKISMLYRVSLSPN